MFLWIVADRSPVALLTGLVLLSLSYSFGVGATHAALCESMPKATRGQGFAVLYATAIAVFGGTTQLMVTWLIHLTGNAMAPAWYLMGSGGIGLIAMSLMFESAPSRALREPAVQPG